MKILVISTMPHDKEGRINRLLLQIVDNDVHIYSPEVFKKNPIYNYYSVSKEMPIGYKAQINFYRNFRKKFKENHKRNFFDIILVLNYSSLPFLKIARKRNKKAKIIYDSFELIIKTREEKKTLRDRFYLWQEKLITKKTNYIITANEERALIMQGRYGLKQKPYIIKNIPTEIPIFKPRKLNENERVSIVYLGYVSKTRKIDKLVDYIANKNELDLYVYGDGDYYKELLDYEEKKEFKNVFVMGRYNQNEIEGILKKHHIGYICYDTKGLNNIYCEPNKIYDYTFHRLPLISFYHPKLYFIFERYQIGISSDNIVEALNEIVKNYNDYQERLVEFNNITEKEIKINQNVLSLIIKDMESENN